MGTEIAKSYIYRRLGIIYEHKGDYDEAFRYYLLEFNILTKIGEQWPVGSSNFRMGKIYFLMSDYDKAIQHLTESLNIRSEIHKKQHIDNRTFRCPNCLLAQ